MTSVAPHLRRPGRLTSMRRSRGAPMAGPLPDRRIGRPRRAVLAVAAVGVAAIATSLLLGSGSSSPRSAGVSSTRGPAGSADSSAVPIPGHEVYGFLPYWELDDSI